MQAPLAEARALHILVIAGVRAYRDALVAVLNDCTDIFAYGRPLGTLPLVDDHVRKPDIIIVDVAAPRGLEAIASLRGGASGIPLIALGVGSDSAEIIVCAEAGAAGYVSAEASIDDLLEAIDNVLSGRLACPPTIAFDLFQMIGTARSTQRSELADFTPREQQVLQLLGSGQSNKEIARILGIAVSTVKNHVHHILEKSEACSRKHAAQKSPFMLASNGHGGASDPVPSLLQI